MDNDEKDKEIIKADKSLISTTKKRGRPKKEKHYWFWLFEIQCNTFWEKNEEEKNKRV